MRGPEVTVTMLLLVTAAQVSSFGVEAYLISGYLNLGDACFYDEECDTITTFCHDRRVCACKERFRETEGRCIASVGARCSSVFDCSSLSDSECVANECVCKEGYVRDSSSYHCLPVVTMYKGQCEEHEQCESFGFASCWDSICRCNDGYHHVAGECRQSAGLGSSCSEDNDCSYNEDERYRLQCRDGRCECREGFKKDDRVCVDGATQTTLSFLVLCVMVVVRIL